MMSTNSATGSTMSHHTLRGVSFTMISRKNSVPSLW